MIDFELHPQVYIYERDPNIINLLEEGLKSQIPELDIRGFNPVDKDQSLFLLPQKRVFLVNGSSPLAVEQEQQTGIKQIEEIAQGIDAAVIQYEIISGEEHTETLKIRSLADLDELCKRVRTSLGI